MSGAVDWQKIHQAVAETVVPATSAQPPVSNPAAGTCAPPSVLARRGLHLSSRLRHGVGPNPLEARCLRHVPQWCEQRVLIMRGGTCHRPPPSPNIYAPWSSSA